MRANIKTNEARIQTVIDDWMEGSDADEFDPDAVPGHQSRPERVPPGGWDAAINIQYARDAIADQSIGLVNENSFEDAIENAATDLYDLGISEHRAVDLIMMDARPSHLTETELAVAIARVYAVQMFEPGSRSRVRPLPPQFTAEEQGDDWMDGGPITDKTWPHAVDYDPKANPAKLADKFMVERTAKLIAAGGDLYTRDGPIWRKLSEAQIEAEIKATDPMLNLDPDKIRKMVRAIHQATYTDAMPYDWLELPENPPQRDDLILFANGILDVKSGKLLKHTGQLFATGLPEFNYDSEADCPLWKAKLAEWLDESFHAMLQEWMGYTMTPDTSMEKLALLVGPPRSGKGTILHINRKLVGPDHHCARTLNEFGEQFGLQGTQDKRLIIVPDAHSTKSSLRGQALERLKSITGRDEVSVQRKNLGTVDVVHPAKIVVACNQTPKFLDESGALAARILPVVFGRSFLGKEDSELRIKLERELPGIANWALAGLRRLRTNGRFTIGAKGKAASANLARAQSTALRFAEDELYVTGDKRDFEPLDLMFTRYTYWAEHDEGLIASERRSRNDFKDDLIAALTARGVTYTRRRWRGAKQSQAGEGERVRGFIGVRFKTIEVEAGDD